MEAIKGALKELKKKLEEKKLILGTKQTLKLVKKKKIEKIYLSSTPPEFLLTSPDLKKVKVERINMNSSELGKYLGKSFPVAVVGVMKHENLR